MKWFTTLFALTFLLNGCLTIYYEEPQPAGTKALKSFPKKIQGVYYNPEEDPENLKDWELLHIHGWAYDWPVSETVALTESELNSREGIEIRDGKIFDERAADGSGVKYTLKNDTISYQLEYIQSAVLGDSIVLKKSGKYYVLNIKEDESRWTAYVIELMKNGDLMVYLHGNFKWEVENTENQEKTLNDFFDESAIEPDGNKDNTYLVFPTKKEFQGLIEDGFFSDTLHIKKLE